jgi:hypothetical protein
MNSFSNIWNHPKTSAAGLLIAVITIAGVLSQQGLTLGAAGTGTTITLVSGLATALLGLLARDPESQTTSTGTTAKLGAWALIALLLPLPFMSGCSGATVAQDIVNWTPALQSAVATVDSTGALLALADAPIFAAATVGFDVGSNLLVGQAKAYLANPTASLLTALQNQAAAFQSQVNTAVLSAAKIVDQASQQHALAVIGAVSTIVSAILSEVQSISSKTALARMAAQTTVTLAETQPYLDGSQAMKIVADHYGEPVELARVQVAQTERNEALAGF